jgi:hypothetical protein
MKKLVLQKLWKYWRRSLVFVVEYLFSCITVYTLALMLLLRLRRLSLTSNFYVEAENFASFYSFTNREGIYSASILLNNGRSRLRPR